MKRFIIEQSDEEFYTSHSGLALVGLCINRYSELPKVINRMMDKKGNVISHTKMKMKFIVIIFCFLFIQGCAPNKPWRTDSDITCFPNTNNTNCVIEQHHGYDICFLEFTERGNLFNNENEELIIDQIREYADKGSAVVIVFVHGWKHNASYNDSNVISFKKALEAISKMMKNRLFDRKIFGLYLGWRGLSLHGLGTENLTFWDRKTVAEEVGKVGVTDIILKLDQMDQFNSRNILFIVGHSFGGAVILSALDEILLDRAIFKKYNPDQALDCIGDGIVLINPAIEANKILKLETIAQNISNFTSNKKIMLHIISSEGDSATKVAFPIGQFLNTALTWRHEPITRKYNEKEYTLSEYDLDLTTVGNYKPFHTANLIENNRTYQKSLPSDGDELHRWKYVDCCQNFEQCSLSNDTEFHISCKKEIPISFLYTSKSFINDHNDIFNKNILSYFSTIVSESLYQQGVEQDKQCIDDIDQSFDFGKCFNHYYELFKISLKQE